MSKLDCDVLLMKRASRTGARRTVGFLLARHRHGRAKASATDIERAPTGNWREENLFVLGQVLAMVDSLAQRVLECDAKIEALLLPLGRHEVELGGPAKPARQEYPAV
jgi:transposase